MAANNNGLCPTGNQTRHILADDRFAENHTAQNIADCAVRAFPHLLEVEFFNAGFIGRDGGAFHRHTVLFGCLGGFNGDPVAGFVTAFDAEIVIVELQIKVWKNQLILDVLPDDPCHLVPVHINDGIGNLDLVHAQNILGVIVEKTPNRRFDPIAIAKHFRGGKGTNHAIAKMNLSV